MNTLQKKHLFKYQWDFDYQYLESLGPITRSEVYNFMEVTMVKYTILLTINQEQAKLYLKNIMKGGE